MTIFELSLKGNLECIYSASATYRHIHDMWTVIQTHYHIITCQVQNKLANLYV